MRERRGGGMKRGRGMKKGGEKRGGGGEGKKMGIETIKDKQTS